MREIKFRIWDYIEKEIIRNEDIKSLDFNSNYFCTDMIEDYFGNEHDNKLMQYTGIKDKNGIEIYEGDIVKIQTVKVNEDDYVIGTVAYSEFEGMYVTNKGYILGRVNHRTEVIGNVYENSELIARPIPKIEDGKCEYCKEKIKYFDNEYEPSLQHGTCKCGYSFTREKKINE